MLRGAQQAVSLCLGVALAVAVEALAVPVLHVLHDGRLACVVEVALLAAAGSGHGQAQGVLGAGAVRLVVVPVGAFAGAGRDVLRSAARQGAGQVGSEQEAVNAYVQAGRSRIMFTADDKTVFVKSVSMNGQVEMDIFDRREKTPLPPASEYVTREELAAAIEALKPAKKAVKTEAAE